MLKTNQHFTKWDGLNILFVLQYIRCFKKFRGSANILLQIPQWGKIEGDLESHISHIFLEAQKYYFPFESRLNFFRNVHIGNVVSTLPNVMKNDIENDNVVSTLPNVAQFNVEIHIALLTLFNVLNFNVDVHNFLSTLIWRFATSQSHINLKTTLLSRLNRLLGSVSMLKKNHRASSRLCIWNEEIKSKTSRKIYMKTKYEIFLQWNTTFFLQ